MNEIDKGQYSFMEYLCMRSYTLRYKARQEKPPNVHLLAQAEECNKLWSVWFIMMLTTNQRVSLRVEMATTLDYKELGFFNEYDKIQGKGDRWT